MCFEKSMMDRRSQSSCNCPMECSSISYSFKVVSTKFEEEEMCQNLGQNGKFWTKQFASTAHKFPPQFIRKLIEVKNDSFISNEVEYCKRNLQYRAEVIFKLATDSMSVTVMSSRMSFFDKMSAFGMSSYKDIPDR